AVLRLRLCRLHRARRRGDHREDEDEAVAISATSRDDVGLLEARRGVRGSAASATAVFADRAGVATVSSVLAAASAAAGTADPAVRARESVPAGGRAAGSAGRTTAVTALTVTTPVAAVDPAVADHTGRTAAASGDEYRRAVVEEQRRAA